MMGKFKKHLVRNIFFTISAIAIVTALVSLIYFYDLILFLIQPPRLASTPKRADRAVILVVEDNGYQKNNLAVETWYRNNKHSADVLLELAMKKPFGYFKNQNSIGEIIDNDGEDFMINALKYEAFDYGKIVPLKDQAASYENFKKTLKDLNDQGYIADLVLSLHGNTHQICFYKECVEVERIVTDLKNANAGIGFVYQTVCDGSGTMNAWIAAGAKAAAGSEKLNTVVVVAPSRFLKEIREGKTYRESVISAYNYELDLYKRLSVFSFGKNYANTVDAGSSKMLFAGNPDFAPFK